MAYGLACTSPGQSRRSRLGSHDIAFGIEMAGTSPAMADVLLAVVAPVIAPAVGLFLAQALERHDLLVLSRVEHDHALGRASGDADTCDRRANELAAIGHQHHLIGLFHRE